VLKEKPQTKHAGTKFIVSFLDYHPLALASRLKCTLCICMLFLTHGTLEDCRWSEPSPWSACSVSCGAGQQTRSRFVAQAAQGEGAKPCTGDPVETQDCPDQPACLATTDVTSAEDSSSSVELTERSHVLNDDFIDQLIEALHDGTTTEKVESTTLETPSTLENDGSLSESPFSCVALQSFFIALLFNIMVMGHYFCFGPCQASPVSCLLT